MIKLNLFVGFQPQFYQQSDSAFALFLLWEVKDPLLVLLPASHGSLINSEAEEARFSFVHVKVLLMKARKASNSDSLPQPGLSVMDLPGHTWLY